VVVLLKGRHAGKKAVIVKNFDEGSGERRYGHAIIAGISRGPLKVTKGMGKRKIAKRIRIKPFIKMVNYNHFMPTRYLMDLDLKGIVVKQAVTDAGRRRKVRKQVRKLFEDRHKAGKNKWFFTKLRF